MTQSPSEGIETAVPKLPKLRINWNAVVDNQKRAGLSFESAGRTSSKMDCSKEWCCSLILRPTGSTVQKPSGPLTTRGLPSGF